MPDFVLPTYPENFPAISQHLTVSSSFEMEDEEYSDLIKAAGLGPENTHVVLRQEAVIGGEPVEIYGLLGIHGRADDSHTDRLGTFGRKKPWLHYKVELFSTRVPKEKIDPRWSAVSTALLTRVPEHVANVTFYVEIPVGSYVPAVRIPIPLGQTEAPGFSEIAGVRLSRKDPDADAKQELYSVILDTGKSSDTAQVRASVDTRWSPTMLVEGLERALAVLKLGVTFSEAVEET